MQALRHDLDATPDPQVLDADLAQGEVEVAEHGVEKGLGQRLAIRFAAQAIDRQGGMQGQRVEAAVERVGNAAGLEQLGRRACSAVRA